MTERWLFGALVAGALLGVAALAAERVAGWFGLPRRWIWAAAMAGSLLLPVVALAAPGLLPSIQLPAWTGGPRAQAPGQGNVVAGGSGADGASIGAAGASPSRLPDAFGVAWLAASLATLGALAWSQRRLRAMCGACVERRVDGTRVRVSESAGPMVLGLLRPEIVVPRWALEPQEDCSLIVRHEREHVQAADPWLLALASLAVAALPWSPALWWQHRRLRLAVETDCDARVVAAGANRRRYGRVLLGTAARPLLLPTPSLTWGGPRSHLERRICALTAQRPRHRVLRAIPFAVVAGAGVAAACGAVSDTPHEADTREAVTRAEPRVDARSGLQGRVSAVKVTADGYTELTLEQDASKRVWTWLIAPPGPLGPNGADARSGLPARGGGLRVGDVILRLLGPGYPGASYVRVIRDGEVRDVRAVPDRPAP
jgi:hypothetical protein